MRVFKRYLAVDQTNPIIGCYGNDSHHYRKEGSEKRMKSLPENLYRAAARIKELKSMKVSFGMRRLIPLFSNGTKAKSQLYYGPFLTLVDHEDLLDWVQDKGDRDHNGPDTHTCACHPEHEKGHQDLFRW